MATVKGDSIQPIVFRAEEQRHGTTLGSLQQLPAKRLNVTPQGPAGMHDCGRAHDIHGVGQCLVEGSIHANGDDDVFGVMGDPCQFGSVERAWVYKTQL